MHIFLYGDHINISINRRTLIINRRVGKDKEINIMTCETICDPVPKMTKLITSPRALEIYAENKKRFVVTPKDRMGFIEAIVAANKRIHVQCTEYAATHRSYEKKRKRALKEEAKKANMDAGISIFFFCKNGILLSCNKYL